MVNIKLTELLQSVQRSTEWRNAIGSTGLAVVNDFMDKTGLNTTEERQQVAADLLFKRKYAYLHTKDIMVDGECDVSLIQPIPFA